MQSALCPIDITKPLCEYSEASIEAMAIVGALFAGGMAALLVVKYKQHHEAKKEREQLK